MAAKKIGQLGLRLGLDVARASGARSRGSPDGRRARYDDGYSGGCVVTTPSGPTVTARLDGTCWSADIADPVKYPSCTVATELREPCDTCELRIGTTSLLLSAPTGPRA